MEKQNNILLGQVIESPADVNFLRNWEIRYRGLLKNLGAGVVVHAPDTSFVMCNYKASELLGLSKDQMKGKLAVDPQWKFLNENNMPLPIEKYPVNQIIISKKEINDFILGINRPVTNDIVWVSVSGFPVLDDKGGLSEIVISFIDITERKKAENNLKKSNKELFQFKIVFDNANFGIAFTKLNGEFIYVNSYFANIHGYSVEELIGKNLSLFHSSDQMERVEQLLAQLLDKGSFYAEEVLHYHRDGITFPMLMTGMLLKNEAGIPEYLTATAIDITDYKLAKAESKKMYDQLNQAHKMEALGILAGGIAHDFNNILSPIIGYTELLSDDIPEDSRLRSSLDEIYAASMRAKDMVRHILTFARQEKGEVKLIKMQHIVKEALKLIRSSIPASIEIKDDIRKECGLINADPTQIHQIVMNLATNAYHAMEERGGIMTISLKEVELNPELNGQVELNPELNEQDIINNNIQKGNYACLTLSDTGTGIPEDIKDKIFDPFFTTKKQGKGTGLGLASVHGIVTNCGGFIRLNSEIGRGTEFNIYLPIAESYLKKDDDFQAAIPVQGGNERILLVDDEAVLITLQKMMLERLGYQVASCTRSLEALEAFRADPDKFDMVITDMTMPNMSGDKLALELIKIRPDIPILLCTGFSTIMAEEQALSMGIKGFLMKPVAINDLDKKIREVLKSSK